MRLVHTTMSEEEGAGDEQILLDIRKIFIGTSEQKSGQRMRCSANCPSDLMSNDNHHLSIILRDDEDEGENEDQTKSFSLFLSPPLLSDSLSRALSLVLNCGGLAVDVFPSSSSSISHFLLFFSLSRKNREQKRDIRQLLLSLSYIHSYFTGVRKKTRQSKISIDHVQSDVSQCSSPDHLRTTESWQSPSPAPG